MRVLFRKGGTHAVGVAVPQVRVEVVGTVGGVVASCQGEQRRGGAQRAQQLLAILGRELRARAFRVV